MASPAPESRPSRWSQWLVAGPVCLVGGLFLGHFLPPILFAGDGSVWSGGSPNPSTRSEPRAEDGAEQARLERVGVPTLAPIVERVASGVVTIRAMLPAEAEPEGADPDGGRPRDDAGSMGVLNGTGFVIHPEGLVVTSRHLVVRAMLVVVDIPGYASSYADVVGEDKVTDLAVLRLQDPPAHLTALELGRSESLRAGDWIVTVGNPYDYPLTVTAGVVSFVGRHLRHYDFGVTNNFLQFSADVHPGSSGSPVLDLEGRVVGVTTQAAVSAQGISFAIPSDTLKWVLDEMDRSDDGRVHRGFLGIGFESRSERDEYGRRGSGALITRVEAEKPADKGGLQTGDVVLFFDDHEVRYASDLHEFVTRARPGTHVRLTVLREGQIIEPLGFELGELGATEEEAADY